MSVDVVFLIFQGIHHRPKEISTGIQKYNSFPNPEQLLVLASAEYILRSCPYNLCQSVPGHGYNSPPPFLISSISNIPTSFNPLLIASYPWSSFESSNPCAVWSLDSTLRISCVLSLSSIGFVLRLLFLAIHENFPFIICIISSLLEMVWGGGAGMYCTKLV